MSQVRRHRGRSYWLRILLANFVGALAVVGINRGWRRGSAPPRSCARSRRDDLRQRDRHAAAVAMPRVAGRCWETPTRRRWAILLTAMAVISIAGTFTANVLLYAVGYVPARPVRRVAVGRPEHRIRHLADHRHRDHRLRVAARSARRCDHRAANQRSGRGGGAPPRRGSAAGVDRVAGAAPLSLQHAEFDRLARPRRSGRRRTDDGTTRLAAPLGARQHGHAARDARRRAAGRSRLPAKRTRSIRGRLRTTRSSSSSVTSGVAVLSSAERSSEAVVPSSVRRRPDRRGRARRSNSAC